MLETSSQIIKSVYSFFNVLPRLGAGVPVYKLPNDIFLDHIFPHLLVEDVCRLRQTNKFFYLLTHEPVVWKRYWERMRILRPQLRPSLDYTSATSNHEFEQLVTQACAVDKFWKTGAVWIKREEILATQFKVIELKFVSGGKFLVASVRDRMSYRFFIIVYAIDLLQGTRAIARMETTYQCYDLDAKYMDYDGEPGITIYYTRRHWERPPRPEDIPRETNFDDPGVRQLILQSHTMIYEACIVHMNLSAVEHLIEQDINIATEKEEYIDRANSHLPPFRYINRFAGKGEITMPTLFEWQGKPYITFFLCPNEIKIFCLDSPYRATIMPNHDTEFPFSQQRIRAIRAIPLQGQLLVIRTVADNPHEEFIHLFELYDIPETGGVHEVSPAARSPAVHLPNYTIDKFTISDSPDPTKKMHPSHPQPLHHERCPPTIWISSSNISPPGVCMWPLRPAELPPVFDEPPSYRYSFDPHRSGPSSIHQSFPSTEVPLPGSERGLVYNYLPSYTEAMIVQRIRRFWFDPDLFGDGYLPAGAEEAPVCEAPRPTRRKFQDVLSKQPVISRINGKGGAVSIAYDESSGKIAVGVSHDNEIQLYDTGTVVHPKHKLIYRYREGLKHPIFNRKRCMVDVS